MKIYVGHSSSFDYIHELYLPIKTSELAKHHEFFFPHEDDSPVKDSSDWIKNADLFVAEGSYPSTGLGIELGYAKCHSVPILAVHRAGEKPSSSIGFVTQRVFEYVDGDDLVNKLGVELRNE